MKNFMLFFYKIDLIEFIKKDNYYIIKTDKDIYWLTNDFSIDSIEIFKYLKINNIYCHEIIKNIYGDFISKFEEIEYILIKIIDSNEKIVDYYYIKKYLINLNSVKEIDWKELWSNKLDYYELQMEEFGTKYPIIKKSFSYFDGLCEASICYLNYLNNKKQTMYVAHKRIFYEDKYLLPTNIVLDTYIRDIAEYIKYEIIVMNSDFNKIKLIIDKLILDYNEAIMLFSRILYPSYYFDIYDLIMKNEKTEDDLNNIIKNSDTFESLLIDVNKYLNYKYKIPLIEW